LAKKLNKIVSDDVQLFIVAVLLGTNNSRKLTQNWSNENRTEAKIAQPKQVVSPITLIGFSPDPLNGVPYSPIAGHRQSRRIAQSSKPSNVYMSSHLYDGSVFMRLANK